MNDFEAFPKMARLFRECVITEKIDGTNAQIFVGEDGVVRAGSRTRWITPEADNFGFAAWVRDHEDELRQLGTGRHFGEWWGRGIQRGYGLTDRRFSLFNAFRWEHERPSCCDVVPILYRGKFNTQEVDQAIKSLAEDGSRAAPGFMRPEGVVVFHLAGCVGFKTMIEGDESHKGYNVDETCKRCGREVDSLFPESYMFACGVAGGETCKLFAAAYRRGIARGVAIAKANAGILFRSEPDDTCINWTRVDRAVAEEVGDAES